MIIFGLVFFAQAQGENEKGYKVSMAPLKK